MQWFLVSPPIAAIALHDRGYIDTATKQEWMTLSTPLLATRFGWRDQYHALQNDADQTRSPQRLLARAVSGYSEGVVTAQTIATLRGISAEEVAAELAEAGVVRMEHQPHGPALLVLALGANFKRATVNSGLAKLND